MIAVTTIQTAVLDGLEQALEGRVNNEGFTLLDGSLYLTIPDLVDEVSRAAAHGVNDREFPYLAEVARGIILSLEECGAVSTAFSPSAGVQGWRLAVPENTTVHMLFEKA